MISKLLRRTSFLAFVALVSFSSYASAETREDKFIERSAAYWPNVDDDSIHPDITAKLESQDFLGAAILAGKWIDTHQMFRSGSDRYSLSLAYIARAIAFKHMNLPESLVYLDVSRAARIGNAKAARTLLERALGNEDASIGDFTIKELIELGVFLNDALALKAASEGLGGTQFSEAERAMYGVLFALQSRGPDFVRKAKEYESQYGRSPEFGNNFIVGPPIAPSQQVPGRDIVATFYAEDTVRTLMSGVGGEAKVSRDEHGITLREHMEFYKWRFESTGFATAYHFVPENPELGEGFILMSMGEILKNIHSGDSVYVRCGPLAHVAVVLSVDRENDQIVFADPLYEFWVPANNSCVEHFANAKRGSFGFVYPELKLSEVAGMLDAVMAPRTYNIPSFVSEESTQLRLKTRRGTKPSSCQARFSEASGFLGVNVEAVKMTDLFTWFNFKQAHDLFPIPRWVSSAYIPDAVKARGKVILSLVADRRGCVSAASLYIRKLYLSDTEQSILLRDLYESFIRAGLGVTDQAILKNRLFSDEKKHVKGFEGVFEGSLRTKRYAIRSKVFTVGRVVADSGAEWIRFEIR